MRSPFDTQGVERGSDGILRYTGLPASIVDALAGAVERDGHLTAVAEIGAQRVTYAELWERAATVAGGLRGQGVKPGDRVAIRLPNGLDWVFAFWGIQLAGAVAVPVNTRLSEPEVAYVLEDSGASYVFEPERALPDGPRLDARRPDRGDLAAIFYTSGTTGFPKGAMVSHENFLANVESAIRCIGLDEPQESQLATLINVPLFHVTGCNSQLLVMTQLGGCAWVLRGALDLDAYLLTIEEQRVQMLTSVPAVYHALMRHPRFAQADVSSVRWVSYGGAPIDPAAVHAIMRAFPNARVGNGFGLTETSSLTTFLPHEDALEHADSVGYPMPVVDLAIEEPDPSTGVGELLVRGQNVVAGYWRKPDATRQALQDGWLRTGDMGRLDGDGRLAIVDRAKDMINRGGENVYSLEVEFALAGAPGVVESAVLPVPDDMMGEKVGAVIVAQGELDVPTVIDHVRGRIADFKVPQFIVVRDEALPRNPGGKVLKKQLAETVEWGAPLR